MVDANTSTALDALRLLKSKTFNYVDTINNTDQTVYGFDTQQVNLVVPYATRITKEKIPNIYQIASIIGNKIIFTNFDTSKLIKNTSNNVYNELIILDANNDPHAVTITNVLNNYILEVNTNLQSYVREKPSGTEGTGGNLVFVYGQNVDDFQTLSKENIYSITTTALQEVDHQLQKVDKQLQEEKSKNVELSNKVHILMNSSQIQTNQDQQLEQQIEKTTLLENKLNLIIEELKEEREKRDELELKLETKINTYTEFVNSLLLNK